jgi:4-hydroxy-tetrahydrodipicolinate synthase
LPSQQVHFFGEVAERAALPVLAYHIPQLTKSELTVSAVVEIATHSKIVGLKDSSGVLGRLLQILERTSASAFSVYQGDELHLVEALSAGVGLYHDGSEHPDG